MTKQLNVKLPEQIDGRLQKVKDQTGLNKSEIARRGIITELDELEKEK